MTLGTSSGPHLWHSLPLILPLVDLLSSTLSQPWRPGLCHFLEAEPPVPSGLFFFLNLPSKLGISRLTDAFQHLILLSPNSVLSLMVKWESWGLAGLGYSRKVVGSGLWRPWELGEESEGREAKVEMGKSLTCSVFGTIVLDCYRLLNCRMQLCWNSLLSHYLSKGVIEGKRRRGRQRMRWLDGITAWWTWLWTNSERVKHSEAYRAAVHGVAGSGTWLSDWTTAKEPIEI